MDKVYSLAFVGIVMGALCLSLASSCDFKRITSECVPKMRTLAISIANPGKNKKALEAFASLCNLYTEMTQCFEEAIQGCPPEMVQPINREQAFAVDPVISMLCEPNTACSWMKMTECIPLDLWTFEENMNKKEVCKAHFEGMPCVNKAKASCTDKFMKEVAEGRMPNFSETEKRCKQLFGDNNADDAHNHSHSHSHGDSHSHSHNHSHSHGDDDSHSHDHDDSHDHSHSHKHSHSHDGSHDHSHSHGDSHIHKHSHSSFKHAVKPAIGPNGEPVEITLLLDLIDIAHVDSKNNQLDVHAWVTHQWTDNRLAWDPEEHDNKTDMRVPYEDIWMPDIQVYSAARKVEEISPKLVLVSSSGEVTWVPIQRMRIFCDLEKLSDEGATCSMTIGSWTFSSYDITLSENSNIRSRLFRTDSRYTILSVNATEKTEIYSCCPEPYDKVDFVFTFKKKPSTEITVDEIEADVDSEETQTDVEKEVDSNGGTDLATDIERLVRNEVRKNIRKGTVVGRSRGYSKSYIWRG